MSEYIRMMLRLRHQPRQPSPGEAEWFAGPGKEIPGYAAEDDRVVLNPGSGMPQQAMDSVHANEAARIEMRRNGDQFAFPMEKHQKDFFRFTPYGHNPQAARQTIVARILAGDPSAGPYTPWQEAAARVSARKMASPGQERMFQDWYRGWADKAGLDPNPDAPEHKYDYRSAYRAGAVPAIDPGDGLYHWPSEFKAEDHPNRFVDGVDTITGRPVR